MGLARRSAETAQAANRTPFMVGAELIKTMDNPPRYSSYQCDRCSKWIPGAYNYQRHRVLFHGDWTNWSDDATEIFAEFKANKPECLILCATAPQKRRAKPRKSRRY